jgi:hypothetical protein
MRDSEDSQGPSTDAASQAGTFETLFNQENVPEDEHRPQQSPCDVVEQVSDNRAPSIVIVIVIIIVIVIVIVVDFAPSLLLGGS